MRLVWFALGLILLSACGGMGEEVLRATPLPTVPEDLRAVTLTPTPTPSPTATPTPTPTPTPEQGPSEPTDSDQARFVAGYQPEGAEDLEHVSVDLGDDGVSELVFVYARESTRLAVAHWTGREYEIVFEDQGGEAARIERLRVADVNADGLVEIATFQATAEGSSLSLWQAISDRALTRLRARGGCHDGSHTYGVTGAELVQEDPRPGEEIRATCGTEDGESHLYVWDGAAYHHEETGDDDSGLEGVLD